MDPGRENLHLGALEEGARGWLQSAASSGDRCLLRSPGHPGKRRKQEEDASRRGCLQAWPPSVTSDHWTLLERDGSGGREGEGREGRARERKEGGRERGEMPVSDGQRAQRPQALRTSRKVQAPGERRPHVWETL